MNRKTMIRNLLAWFGVNARDLPWRRTLDPYAIWVSEIMLQQTQVKTVLPYWSRWMRTFPTVGHLARARPERIHKLWEGLGYYTRVRNMQAAAHVIVREHRGAFPKDYDSIVALPGVGPYTAGAISSIAFDQPSPVMDGNIIRVLTRCFGIKGNPRRGDTNARLWRLAKELVTEASAHKGKSASRRKAAGNSQRRCSQFNQSLMELGALVCTPRKPNCVACPISAFCVAFKHGIVEKFPETPRRPAASRRHVVAFVVRRGGRFLVRKRPAAGVNAHLWEFPNLDVTGNGSDLARAARHALGTKPALLKQLGTIQHTITRYNITLDVFEAFAAFESGGGAGRWLPLSHMRRLPFCGAHKQILRWLPST